MDYNFTDKRFRGTIFRRNSSKAIEAKAYYRSLVATVAGHGGFVAASRAGDDMIFQLWAPEGMVWDRHGLGESAVVTFQFDVSSDCDLSEMRAMLLVADGGVRKV